MSTTPRKARGPRTSGERIEVAARRAATTLEDAIAALPSGDSSFGQYHRELLEPLATLLRFYYGSASAKRAEAAEQAYIGLAARLRASSRYAPEIVSQPGVANGELLEEFRATVDELKHRLGNYVVMADAESEAANEGLVLGTKAETIWRAGNIFSRTHELERLAAGVSP
jgi:hypothetical protein